MLHSYSFRKSSMPGWTWLRWIAGCAVVLATSGPPAHATLSINAAVGGTPFDASLLNFDDLPLGPIGGTSRAGVRISATSDAQAVEGFLSGRYAAPYLSRDDGKSFGELSDGPDATTYLSTGLGTITLTFPQPEKYLGLLWGSVDAYNTLTIYRSGKVIGTITGSDVTDNPDGDQGPNGSYYVNITSTDPFDMAVASSTQYAFEIDNIAFNPAAVPEPATTTVLGAGLLLLSYTRRRTWVRHQIRTRRQDSGGCTRSGPGSKMSTGDLRPYDSRAWQGGPNSHLAAPDGTRASGSISRVPKGAAYLKRAFYQLISEG